MRIATQNINWGGEPIAPGCNDEPRLARLVPRLVELAADVLVLTEFKVGPLEDELKALLAVAGYLHLLSHPQGPRNPGTAIASTGRWSWSVLERVSVGAAGWPHGPLLVFAYLGTSGKTSVMCYVKTQ